MNDAYIQIFVGTVIKLDVRQGPCFFMQVMSIRQECCA